MNKRIISLISCILAGVIMMSPVCGVRAFALEMNIPDTVDGRKPDNIKYYNKVSDFVFDNWSDDYSFDNDGEHEFQTKRLIVCMDEGKKIAPPNYGTKKYAKLSSENVYVLQFDSEEQAGEAYKKLSKKNKVVYCEPDRYISIEPEFVISAGSEKNRSRFKSPTTKKKDKSKGKKAKSIWDDWDSYWNNFDWNDFEWDDFEWDDWDNYDWDGFDWGDVPDDPADPYNPYDPYDPYEPYDPYDDSYNDYGSYSWNVTMLGMDKMIANIKAAGITGEVTVGVVDTGIDYTHPYLADSMVSKGYDFISNDYDAYDGNSHGTHVAGIIKQTTEGLPIKLLPVKVLSDSGEGTSLTVYNGIRYAADQGADVINLSLGGVSSGTGHYEDQAITYAINKGVVVCVAAGNENSDSAYFCPGHNLDAIVTSAIDSGYNKAYFSNYGKSIDVGMPGVDIYSSIPGGGYAYYSGTSMAAPHLSGVAAAIKLCYPSYNNAKVEQIIRSMAVDIGDAGYDYYYGYGVPDMSKFDVTGSAAPTAVPAPTVAPKPTSAPIPTSVPMPTWTPIPTSTPIIGGGGYSSSIVASGNILSISFSGGSDIDKLVITCGGSTKTYNNTTGVLAAADVYTLSGHGSYSVTIYYKNGSTNVISQGSY